MSTFIALRRKSRVETMGTLSTLSVEDRRARLVNNTASPELADELAGLGLEQSTLEEPAADAQSNFLFLEYVDAYVLNTPNRQKNEQVLETFEHSAYHIVPDVQLFLPKPARLERVRHRGRHPAWPVESGVQLAHRNGVTGDGVLVGVLDTGCDADHLEFREKRIDFRYVPLHPTPDTLRDVRGFDVDGHGTHVCGIIAGRNVGIAPNTELMVASIIESETHRTNLVRLGIALDWMLSQFHREENLSKPVIVSMSLGLKPEWLQPPDLHKLVEDIRNLLSLLVKDFAILPVVAIGNDGSGNMRAPGYFPETLSVGAVDFNHEPVEWSGGGSSPLDGETQPDLVGYGVGILSSLERDQNNQSFYARMDGTSMATPYVTGIAALHASMDVTLNGNVLRHHLINTALPLQASTDRVGAGLARFI